KKIDHVSTDIFTADREAVAVPEELPLPSEEPQDEKRQTEASPSAATPVQAVLKDLRVSSFTPDSVQLQWSVPGTPFDSFVLQYRDAQGQPQALPVDGGSRSVTVPGLSPSHRYRFHLYGLRGRKRVYHISTEAVTGEGDANLDEPPMPSEELQPEDTQPKDPPVESPSSDTPLARAVLGELRVSSVMPNSAQLQWSVRKGPFDSFMLQYRDAQGQPQALPIDGGSRSVTVPGLSPSHRYRFHLYGLQGGKRIDRASTDIITAKTEELPLPSKEPQPEDPKGKDPPSEAPLARAVLRELRVSSVTPSSAQLQWSVPEGPFDSFMLQYQDAQGQPQALPIDGGSRSVTVR
ncbi:TENX protein, partial [Locustella ochotensis]|nr:TENX protein [Locustella ochotensis]